MDSVKSFDVKGAEVKKDGGGQIIIGFSSQKITDDQLKSIPDLSGDYLLAFYSCDLSNCNFEILRNSGLERMAIIYSKFDGSKLKELQTVKSLKFLKLIDVEVSDNDVREALRENPDLRVE